MKRNRTKKKRLKPKVFVALLALIAVVVLLVVILSNLGKSDAKKTAQTSASSSKTTATTKKKSDLPDAKQSDWDLVLVNRENPKAEMNPNLATVGSIQVDSRIASTVEEFLAAAQQIDPAEHLISGYRSVAYQTQLYNSYVENEMVGGAGAVNDTGQAISREQAEKNVQTYSQPPESSEHETGLAIDMSDVDALNQSPVAIATKVAEIAPEYGFVLRFTEEGKNSTGVDHEDWHYRYVGVANAKYMTAHHLTLEEYLKLLPK